MSGNQSTDSFFVNGALSGTGKHFVTDFQDSNGKNVPQFVKNIQIEDIDNTMRVFRNGATDGRDYIAGLAFRLDPEKVLHDLSKLEISGTDADVIDIEYEE